MPRTTPPDRLQAVAAAACRVFIEKGYRRARMTDVGASLELSHALLYSYVESKEALFELALIYAIDPDSISGIRVPLATPSDERTFAPLRKWARNATSFPVLGAALAQQEPDDVTMELSAIIDERYAFMEENGRLLSLIRASRLDLPELTAVFVRRRRAHLRQLVDYLDRRIASGHLGPVSDQEVAARFIVETIAWFAWHRKGDPDSSTIRDEAATRTVRELLLAAFVPSTARRQDRRRTDAHPSNRP